MSTKISTSKTTENSIVWWRFEKDGFVGYTNDEKKQFEHIYQPIDEWWIFSSVNPKEFMTYDDAVDYYKNLAIFLAKNIDNYKIPYILRSLNWINYISSIQNIQISYSADDATDNQMLCESEEIERSCSCSGCQALSDENLEYYVKRSRGRGRPIGSKNKPKVIPAVVRRSYRVISSNQ